jgi:hypothetical protein
MKAGIPPKQGGSLDQSAWFMNFHAIYNSEQNRAEIEAHKRL